MLVLSNYYLRSTYEKRVTLPRSCAKNNIKIRTEYTYETYLLQICVSDKNSTLYCKDVNKQIVEQEYTKLKRILLTAATDALGKRKKDFKKSDRYERCVKCSMKFQRC